MKERVTIDDNESWHEFSWKNPNQDERIFNFHIDKMFTCDVSSFFYSQMEEKEAKKFHEAVVSLSPFNKMEKKPFLAPLHVEHSQKHRISFFGVLRLPMMLVWNATNIFDSRCECVGRQCGGSEWKMEKMKFLYAEFPLCAKIEAKIFCILNKLKERNENLLIKLLQLFLHPFLFLLLLTTFWIAVSK